MANRIVLNETSYRGADAIQETAGEARAKGFEEAFVYSDPGLAKFSVTCRVTKVLEDAGLAYEIYSDIKPNPTIKNVQTGVAAFEAPGTNYIITVGGSSSMDTSEAIDVIITNPEFKNVRSLKGVAPAKNPYVPIIAVPTAASTTAETTTNYVITDVEKKRKFVCVDAHDIPVVAVTDPKMMSSMPKGLTAATGMDALTHTIEGYTTKGAWEMTDMLNLKTIEVIARSLRDAVENRPEGREGITLGQYLIRVEFPNYGLGVVHSMTYGLDALYDTPHSVTDAVVLPTVTEYNAPCIGTKFKDIVVAMGMEGAENMTQEEYRKVAADAVKKLSVDVDIPADLKEIVKPGDVDFLSQSAVDDACRPGNPKGPSFEDIKDPYLSLM